MPEPSSNVLRTLRQSGNMERLAREARHFLGRDPEDPVAHYYLADALLNLEERKAAKPHIDFLLGVDPDSASYHHLAIEYYRLASRWAGLRHHVAEGLRIDPTNVDFHYYAALGEVARMQTGRAMQHIQWARQQAPDDPDIANLYLQIRGATETSATAAWTRVAEFERALLFDPESAALHDGLGDVYLEELEDPRTAEGHYREAVRLDPRNRHYQRDLFQAVAKRDLIYRLVSIPSRTFSWLRLLLESIQHQPWRILFLLIAIKGVLAFLIWLVVMTILLWPAGKIYEWLLVSELKSGTRTGLTHLRLWHRFQRLPRILRSSLFLAVIAATYAALFRLMNVPLVSGFRVVGILILIHFSFILAFFVYRRVKASLARNRSAKQLRKHEGAHPPPLPD